MDSHMFCQGLQQISQLIYIIIRLAFQDYRCTAIIQKLQGQKQLLNTASVIQQFAISITIINLYNLIYQLLVLIQQSNQSMQLSPVSEEFKSLPTRGVFNSPALWLQQKAARDQKLHNNPQDKPNIWTIDNKNYDLSDFIAKHPGGSHWIASTRGQDITELYHIHHLDRAKADALLPKYYISDAPQKMTRYTFEQSGFYMTLKRKILKQFPIKKLQENTRSKVLACVILAIFGVCFTATCMTQSYIWAFLTAYTMIGLIGMGHNFMHQKENPWRYLYEFTGFSHKEWEVMHAISHHVFPNTELDYEIAAFEPVVYYLRTKPINPVYIQFILEPFFFIMLPFNMFLKLLTPLFVKHRKFDPINLMPFTELLILFLATGSLGKSCALFAFIHACFGVIFTKTVFCGHRPQDLWTAGCPQIRDFGEHTVASTSDISTYIGGLLSMYLFSGFNVHVLHHLFPTIDHSHLVDLVPLLEETVKEFELNYNVKNKWECMKSVSKGLVKRIPYQKEKAKSA